MVSDCSTSAERRRHRSTSLSKAKQDTPKEKGRRNVFNICVSDSDTDELEQSVTVPKPQERSAKMRIGNTSLQSSIHESEFLGLVCLLLLCWQEKGGFALL